MKKLFERPSGSLVIPGREKVQEKSDTEKLAEFNALPNGTRIKLLKSIDCDENTRREFVSAWPAGTELTVIHNIKPGYIENGARTLDGESFKSAEYIIKAGYLVVS